MLIVLLVLIGLSFLILAHEAAHFFFAKFFGLKVDEFGFGFPPRIFFKKKGETKYSLNWIPFGGFVRIAGEDGEFETLENPAGGGSVPPLSEGRLGGVIVSKRTGDIIPSSSPSERGRVSRLFFAQPAWKKSIIVLGGVAMNFVIGWLLISGALMIGTPKAVIVTDIQPNSPAAAAGIQEGDAVKGFATAQEVIDFVNAHRGQPIGLSFLRNAREVDVTVTPRITTAPNEGAVGIGLADAGSPREAPLPALRDGFLASLSLFGGIFLAFGGLISQIFIHASLPAGVVGPVGIFGVAEETGKIGLVYLLQFIGIISINLAVVNLIPFPALDGGRFVMILIEKIKGSAVPQKIEAWVNGFGFAFLLLLMLLLTIRDVWNLW
jgi:regulator of sigma E protease